MPVVIFLHFLGRGPERVFASHLSSLFSFKPALNRAVGVLTSATPASAARTGILEQNDDPLPSAQTV
jgi:hypothetical protein